MRKNFRKLGVVLMVMLSGLLIFSTTAYASHDRHRGDHDDTEYGAFINEGTCDDIGNRVIDDIGDLDWDDDVWRVVGQGTPIRDQIYGEDEDIRPSIGDLLASEYVVVIRAHDSRTADVIACGEITGKTDAKGNLTISLHEVDNSGIEGRVVFEPRQHGYDQTRVTTAVWPITEGTPVSDSGRSLAVTAML